MLIAFGMEGLRGYVYDESVQAGPPGEKWIFPHFVPCFLLSSSFSSDSEL